MFGPRIIKTGARLIIGFLSAFIILTRWNNYIEARDAFQFILSLESSYACSGKKSFEPEISSSTRHTVTGKQMSKLAPFVHGFFPWRVSDSSEAFYPRILYEKSKNSLAKNILIFNYNTNKI